MWERLFPRPIDNRYLGHPIALWLFVPATAVIIGRSCVHIFWADGGAQSIATIPLDTYPSGAAATIVVLFGMWGVHQLLLAGLYVLVLLRYRAMIPLMWLTLLIEWASRPLLGLMKGPSETLETPPGARGVLIWVPLSLVMIWLSLRRTALPHTGRRLD